jgi:hypothetical protein
MGIVQEAQKRVKNLAGQLLRPVRAGTGNIATEKERPDTLKVTTPAFQNGAPIPARHAAEQNVSPALSWSGVPADAQEIVVLVEIPTPLRRSRSFTGRSTEFRRASPRSPRVSARSRPRPRAPSKGRIRVEVRASSAPSLPRGTGRTTTISRSSLSTRRSAWGPEPIATRSSTR